MADDDFEAAWRISDRVLQERDPSKRDDPTQPYHLRWVWDGRAFDGKDVLVRCYHGLGDTVQFSRFLPELRRRARRLIVEMQPELIPLFTGLDGAEALVPFRPARPLSSSECDLEIMELAHALRSRPAPIPYLPIQVPRRESSPRLRVGLSWQSSPTWLQERSLPRAMVEMILSQPGIDFVSLQRNADTIGFLNDCPEAIEDTARRIAGLDLVISVDTMVAHLAGAMGKRLWLLLKAEPDWRWMGGGRGSAWYAKVRKYVQPGPGNWLEPVAELIADLTVTARAGTLPVV